MRSWSVFLNIKEGPPCGRIQFVTTASFPYGSTQGHKAPPIDPALTGQPYKEPIRVTPDCGCDRLSLPDSTRLRQSGT